MASWASAFGAADCRYGSGSRRRIQHAALCSLAHTAPTLRHAAADSARVREGFGGGRRNPLKRIETAGADRPQRPPEFGIGSVAG